MVTINNDQREDQMFNIETNSVAFIVAYLFLYLGLICLTVPSRIGKIVLSVYGLIFIAVFKITIDVVPLV